MICMSDNESGDIENFCCSCSQVSVSCADIVPRVRPLSPPGRGLFAMTCERHECDQHTCCGASKSSLANRVRGDTIAGGVTPPPFAPKTCSGHPTTDVYLGDDQGSSRPSQIQGAKPSPSRERGSCAMGLGVAAAQDAPAYSTIPMNSRRMSGSSR